MSKIGDRVAAVKSSSGDTVELYGYGVYVGDEVPVTSGGFMGEFLRALGRVNPKILLDTGQVVWGCECWWGSEAGLKASIGSRTIVLADIDADRAAYKEAQ